MKVNVTIPVFNRCKTIRKAIDSALNQTYEDTCVTVVDDGSKDGTWDIIKEYSSEPRFGALRLKKNVGTAQAKNVSLLLSDYEAITFHDSDDVALPNKVLLQCRALLRTGHFADEILNWKALGHVPESELEIDVAVGAYNLLKMDGSVHRINKRISLLDDFFPNLQFPSKTEGDWCLVNAGLFRKKVFQKLGGYLDSIEEDRELRNRAIASGMIFYFLEEPLLDKIEMSDSLTVKDETNYVATKRLADRKEVWERNDAYCKGLWGEEAAREMRVPFNLDHVALADIINPDAFTLNQDLPASAKTVEKFKAFSKMAFVEPPRGTVWQLQ